MEQIDAKSVQFLNAVRYSGGEANISEIRRLSGLSRDETNYRFRKLTDKGLIEIGYTDSPGDLPDRKVAQLTGKARRELERGLGSATTAGLVLSEEPKADEVSRERFIEFERELQKVRQAQQATVLDGMNGVSEEDFEDFEEYVYEWNEAVETYLYALRGIVERELGIDFKQELEEVGDD